MKILYSQMTTMACVYVNECGACVSLREYDCSEKESTYALFIITNLQQKSNKNQHCTYNMKKYEARTLATEERKISKIIII